MQFKNKKLEKELNERKKLEKTHGRQRAKKIKFRLAALRTASSLYDFWPPKRGHS